MDESRAPLQTAASEPTSAASQPPLVPVDGVNLEIANGTRDDALADEVTAIVKLNGFDVDRISGLRPYTQHRTVILYRDGFYKQALALSRTFPKPPAIVNNTHTRRASDKSDVRLVIGKWTPQALHPQQVAASH